MTSAFLAGQHWLARDPQKTGGEFMAGKKEHSNEELRRNAVEKMWLHYFNNGLLEQGLITESMHRRMKLNISTRRPVNKVRDREDLELR